MVSHGKAIEEIFSMFNKRDQIDNDLAYNWTGMVELTLQDKYQTENYESAEGREQVFNKIQITDFDIIYK